MNHEVEAAAVAALCQAAAVVTTCGAQYARADDPHRFASLPREFDGGKARPRLVMDYLGNGQVRIALQFIGTKFGEERITELFATTVQGPVMDGAH